MRAGVIVCLIVLVSGFTSVFGQGFDSTRPPAAPRDTLTINDAAKAWDADTAWERTIDTISAEWYKADSMFRADSVRLSNEFRNLKQFATMREVDLTGDGKPETLRLSGKAMKDVRDVKLEFTIRNGKELLYKDAWSARGYFDEGDTLSDFTRTRRLHRIVTVFFANENFMPVDSAGFSQFLPNVTQGEIALGSDLFHAVFQSPKIQYSVFKSRDLWYGLIWDPSQRKFLRAWTN